MQARDQAHISASQVHDGPAMSLCMHSGCPNGGPCRYATDGGHIVVLPASVPSFSPLVTKTDPPNAAHLTIARDLRLAQEEIERLRLSLRERGDWIADLTRDRDERAAQCLEEREHSDDLAAVLNACRHYLPSARFKVKGEPRRRADPREARMPELRMRFWLLVMRLTARAGRVVTWVYFYAVEKAGDAAHERRLPGDDGGSR